MKKLISILLSVLILTSSVGVSFATHFCRGKVYNRSINFLSDSMPGCGMETDAYGKCLNSETQFEKRCCENEITSYQIEDSYKIPAIDKEITIGLTFIQSYFLYTIFNTEKSVSPVFDSNFSPPLKTDIFVRIQSFLI